MDDAVSAAAACGRASIIGSTGRLQPMTPVEEGNTCRGFSPSTRAVSVQIRSAVSTPAGAHTLEILLLMMIAPRSGSCSRWRPTTTGAPGRALRVKTAAKSGVG
jgi:hypothetical protein